MPEATGGFVDHAFANEVCIVDLDNRLKCEARRGAIGESATPATWWERLPVPVEQVVSTFDGLCARATSGNVWCWGLHWGRQFDEPFRVELPAAAASIVGTAHTACALTVDGELHCWGRHAAPELPPEPLASEEGQVSYTGREVVPTTVHKVSGIPPLVGVLPLRGTAAVGWTQEGAVWMWGGGFEGVRDGIYHPEVLALDRVGRLRGAKRIFRSGIVDAFNVGLKGPCFVHHNGNLHCLERHRGLGLEELADRVCYLDGPRSRETRTRGERLAPPPTSTCN